MSHGHAHHNHTHSATADSCGSAGGCGHDMVFDGVSAAYKRALIAVIAINAVMFFVEMSAGFAAQSQALKADALDFAMDALTYSISLAVIGMAASVRAKAALFKSASLGLMAIIILGGVAWKVISGDPPSGQIMSGIGLLALAANVLSVLILMRWRDGDANVRSVWLCSRNDAIGNVGVVVAGVLTYFTLSIWPDVIMAALLATLFLRSAWAIFKQARAELAAS